MMAKAIEKKQEAKPNKAVMDFNKLPPAKRLAVRSRRLSKKVHELAKSLGESQEVAADRALVTGAVTALEGVADHLEQLPDTFRPGKQAVVAKVEVGATVALRDQYRKDFEGLLDPKELDQLKVLAIKGRVFVQVPSGAKMFFPRGHLAPVKAA